MAEIKKISTELQLLDKFLDTSGDAGTSGQVLTSTGTGINWVSGGSLPGGPYLPLSAGSSYPLTGDLYINKSVNGLSFARVTNTNTGTSANARFQVAAQSSQIDMIATSAGYTGVTGWADAGIVSTDSGASTGLILNAVSGEVQIQTAQTTALTISSGQNSTFAGNLTINGAVTTFNPDADSRLRILNAGTNAIAVFAEVGDTLYLGGNNTTGMTLDASANASFFGNVGIGVTSPNAKLSLAGGSNINSQNSVLYIDTNSYYASSADRYITSSTAARYFQLNGEHVWSNAASGTAGNAISFAERMRIDSAGRVGIGVTPKNWTTFTPIQIGQASSFVGRISSNQTDVATNWYYDGAEKRIASGYAQRYTQTAGGEHQWFTAGTDNADSTITFSQKLTIKNNGNVGIGTTSPRGKLDVVGNTDNDADFLTIQDDDPSAGSSRPSIRFRSNTAQIGQIVGLNGSMRFSSGTTENSMLEILDNGNVGVGASNPQSKLQIQANQHAANPGGKNYTGSAINADGGDIATGKLYLQGYQKTANDLCGFNNEADRVVLYNYTDARYLQLWNHNGDTFIPNGNVGIGTTLPQGKLHVKDTDTQLVLETSNATADIDFRFRENGNNQWNLSYQNSTNNLIFYNQTAASSAQLTLAANGTSTFTGLVSGITPTAAANFTTKDYVDTAISGVSSGVTSVATTNGITGGTITSTGTIQVDDTVARVYKGISGNVSSSAYKTAFTVNGGNLSSHIRFSVQGTTNSVVISNLIDLAVNHYQDIQLTALSGNYTKLSVKVISNNNEDYEVQFKTNSTNAVTLYLEVFPLGSETITFTSTSSFTGTTGTFADLPYGNYMNGTGGDEGDLFIGGNFTVQEGGIVLNGTGRVQGIDTVSATTDAANKTYVDTAVAGAGSGTFLPLAGGTMDSSALIGGSGTLELGGSGVTNLLLDSDGVNIMQFKKASASLQYAQIISDEDKVRLRFKNGMDIYYDDTAIIDYMKFHALSLTTTQFKNDNFEIIGIGANNDEMLFKAEGGGAVSLYYNNVLQLNTTSTGIQTNTIDATVAAGSAGNFVVMDGTRLAYRTAAQVLSDIGAASSGSAMTGFGVSNLVSGTGSTFTITNGQTVGILGGTNITSSVNTTNETITLSTLNPASGNWFRGVPQIGSDGLMEVGRYIDFHNTDTATSDFDVRLDCYSANNLRLTGSLNVTQKIVVNSQLGVGITPAAGISLEVDGKIRADDSNSGDYVQMYCDGSVSGDSLIENTNSSIVIKSANATTRIDASGAAANLEVLNASNVATIRLRGAADSFIAGGDLGIGNTGPVSGIKLDVTGKVLIKTSDGVSDLYMGNYSVNKYVRFHTNNSNTYFDINCGHIYWRVGSSTKYDFDIANGNMQIDGTLTQSSDIRLKENITEIGDCISKVKAMRGVYYNKIESNKEDVKVGVIAQEVETVLPELISESLEDGFKSVAYSELTAVLINAIKEQQEIIEDLKTRITKLEN